MTSENSDLYSAQRLLTKLLELGRDGDFDAVQRFSRVVRLPSYPRYGEVIAFSNELSQADLEALIKAIAKFEDAMGGGGSPSMNWPLLCWGRARGNRETFDWVLRNCRWYYSKGAKSLEEYERNEFMAELRREASEVPKIERHLEAFRRKAKDATNSVCGAIRRKDARAVAALLRKGADPDIVCPDGNTVTGFAEAAGNEELLRTLEESLGFHSLMRELTAMGYEERFVDAVELGRRCRNDLPSGISTLIEDTSAGFRDEMSPDDFNARAKALAMFEMGFGWQGDKSFVALLAYQPQGDNRLFDWVLRNTSGWHFAKGRRSLSEFQEYPPRPVAFKDCSSTNC